MMAGGDRNAWLDTDPESSSGHAYAGMVGQLLYGNAFRQVAGEIYRATTFSSDKIG